ncbi:MAG: twitching motility protein PilJ [bacterium]
MHTLNKRIKQRRLGAPLICLALALLALTVSIVSLSNTASIANKHAKEFQTTWQALQDGSVEGSEIVAANRLMTSVLSPAQQLQNSATWSLGLVVLCFIIFAWLIHVVRGILLEKTSAQANQEFSEHAAMMKLIDEISPLATGDLRATATVSENATGSLAETFNYAVGELRWLVSLLGSSAEHLSDSVDKSRYTAEKVSFACAEQSRQIHRSSNCLFSMSATMSGLSADASESTLAAQTAVNKAEAGGLALGASLKTLSAIRDEADNTTRLMHRLANNVEAIDERVIRVQEVAKQTDLLALNTTIRASAGSRHASANDAAADLGRLSDEVAQLAEVLGQATRDIGSLTQIISQDASETVQSMEHISAELVSGVRQTQHANDALVVIQDNSRALHERVLVMTERCVEQSGIVRQLTENMDQLNQITDQASEGVALNSSSLDELQKLSTDLRLRMAEFQLPNLQSALDQRQNLPSTARRAADRAVNA